MRPYEPASDTGLFSSLPSHSHFSTDQPKHSARLAEKRKAEDNKAATMLSAILRMIRDLAINIFATALIIGIFVDEPTFRVFHQLLLWMHITARFLFLYFQSEFRDAIANFDLAASLASYGHSLLVFSAPVLRPVLPWVTRLGTQIVHLSPRFLCYVNGGVVETGKYVVDVVMGKDAGELKEMWKIVGKEVAGFCKAPMADSNIWSAFGL
jgi:hypothetical protein